MRTLNVLSLIRPWNYIWLQQLGILCTSAHSAHCVIACFMKLNSDSLIWLAWMMCQTGEIASRHRFPCACWIVSYKLTTACSLALHHTLKRFCALRHTQWLHHTLYVFFTHTYRRGARTWNGSALWMKGTSSTSRYVHAANPFEQHTPLEVGEPAKFKVPDLFHAPSDPHWFLLFLWWRSVTVHGAKKAPPP